MGFFDDIGNRLSGIGQEAIGKTQNFTEVMRINSEISDMEKGINVSYMEIGKLYYRKYAAESEDQEILVHARRIASNLQRIEELQEQIRSIKGIVRCKNCGADVDANAVYCNRCGAKQVPDIVIQAKGKICPDCGKEIAEGQIFCTGCGRKLDAEVLQVEPEEPAKRECPNCGAELGEGAGFCSNCGTQVKL